MPGMLLVAGRVLFTFFLCTQSRTAHPPPKTNPSDTTSQSQQAEDTLQANMLPFPHRDTTEKLPLPAEAFRRAQGRTSRAVGCRSMLSHAWEQQAGGRGEQEAPGTREAVHRESGAQREVPEGEWEGMRADMYSIIIAAFQAAPAKCLGVCYSRERSQTLRKQGPALSRISSGPGVRG